MRAILIAVSTVAVLLSQSFADGGFTGSVEPILPGFDLKDELPASSSGPHLSPAVTFSTMMKGAFMTPDGIKLASAPHGTVVSQWGGSKNGARRMRAIIGATPPSGGTGGTGSGTTGTPVVTGGNPTAAVPEPGTFLTGLLLFGVCANSRQRGRCRA